MQVQDLPMLPITSFRVDKLLLLCSEEEMYGLISPLRMFCKVQSAYKMENVSQTFMMNLSASFVCERFKDPLMAAFP